MLIDDPSAFRAVDAPISAKIEAAYQSYAAIPLREATGSILADARFRDAFRSDIMQRLSICCITRCIAPELPNTGIGRIVKRKPAGLLR